MTTTTLEPERLQAYRTAERPDLELWVRTRKDGPLVDFSAGYTFVFKLGSPGAAAVLTKTTGITGAAGAGTELDGVPNVTISFTADELVLAAGIYRWQLRATTAGTLDRVYGGWFEVLDIIT